MKRDFRYWNCSKAVKSVRVLDGRIEYLHQSALSYHMKILCESGSSNKQTGR